MKQTISLPWRPRRALTRRIHGRRRGQDSMFALSLPTIALRQLTREERARTANAAATVPYPFFIVAVLRGVEEQCLREEFPKVAKVKLRPGSRDFIGRR